MQSESGKVHFLPKSAKDSISLVQSQRGFVLWNLHRHRGFAMTAFAALGQWLHGAEPVLPLVAGFLSVAILFGCAVASWIAPSEKTDCLFHREVI